jgi:hypothetical protein
LLSNLASSCHTRDEFPTSLESPIPRLAPRGRIFDFYRTFHLPAKQEMFFSNSLLGYQLKETLGVRDLWMQVDNLTNLWILWLHYRIPKNHCQPRDAALCALLRRAHCQRSSRPRKAARATSCKRLAADSMCDKLLLKAGRPLYSGVIPETDIGGSYAYGARPRF